MVRVISDPEQREFLLELGDRISSEQNTFWTAAVSALAVLAGSGLTYLVQNWNNRKQTVREGKIATLRELKDDLHDHRENFRKRKTHRQTESSVTTSRLGECLKFRKRTVTPDPGPFPFDVEAENESIIEAHVALIGNKDLKDKVNRWLFYAKEFFSSVDHELDSATETQRWRDLINRIGELIRQPDEK